MAKYTSDPNLMRGAGIAYKDWSNVPGMYAGLDKGIKTAQKAITKAFEEKAKEKKKADDQIDARWDIANHVYENSGSFMKTPELDSVHRELEQIGEDINKAKEILSQSGYQVYNLWSIEDVQNSYDCTDEQAMEVLIQALTNDHTMDQIWFAINFHAEDNGLKTTQTL